MSAATLRLDAVRMIKTVLAGTATKHFTDVIEAVFGGVEDKSIKRAMEAEEGIPPDNDDDDEEEEDVPSEPTVEPSVSTLSKAMKRKAPPPTDNPKRSAPSKKTSPICAPEDATIIYPSTKEEDRYLHAGVDNRFISSRKSSAVTQRAGYGCLYSTIMREEGTIMEECEFISSTRSQLSTHIRRSHLGAVVVCYVCDERWWGASTWLEHMEKVHPSLKRKDYFVKEGTDIAELKSALTIKQEVSAEEL